MRKNLSLFVIALCCFASQAQAQVDEARPPRYLLSQKKFTFAVQPFQLFNNSLRADFEMRLGNGPGWLQFGPAIYYANHEKIQSDHLYDGKQDRYDYGMFRLREPYSKLKGGGLDVNYKRFLNANRSFYMATGLSYTYFDITYYGSYRTWIDYIEDELPYHEYRYTTGYLNQHINRLSINHYFGFQPPTRSAFLFDMFWGVSYRHCFMDKEKPSFDQSVFSYGYSGPAVMMGIRLGFGIK